MLVPVHSLLITSETRQGLDASLGSRGFPEADKAQMGRTPTHLGKTK
jgi:hypothetical protein